MSSPVVFSITGPQLEALRSLPRPIPQKAGYPDLAIDSLIVKGLADLSGARITITPQGMRLLTALDGLAQRTRQSQASDG